MVHEKMFCDLQLGTTGRDATGFRRTNACLPLFADANKEIMN